MRLRFLAVLAWAVTLMVPASAVRADAASTSAETVPGSAALARELVGAPSATSTYNGAWVDVFAVGDDGWLYQWYLRNNTWDVTNFLPPAARIIGSPSATWTAGGRRLDVLVTGWNDGHVHQKYWDTSGWHGWFDLGSPPGVWLAGVSASWKGDGRGIDVFAVGSDGYLYQKYWTALGWFGWTRHSPPPGGFKPGSGPAVTWAANGARLDVHATAANGHLYQKTLDYTWHGWADAGGSLLTTPAAAWVNNTSRVDIFGIGTDRRLYQKYYDASGWHGWYGFSGPPVGIRSAPTITWAANGSRLWIFVVGSDGDMFDLEWSPLTGWTDWDRFPF